MDNGSRIIRPIVLTRFDGLHSGSSVGYRFAVAPGELRIISFLRMCGSEEKPFHSAFLTACSVRRHKYCNISHGYY